MGEFIDKLEVQVVGRSKYLGMKAKETVKDFFTKEDGDVNVVSIVILIGIAVVLALTFKKEITGIVETLLGDIKTKAKEATSSGK